MNIHIQEVLQETPLASPFCIWVVSDQLELRSANLAGRQKLHEPASSLVLRDGRLTSPDKRLRDILRELVSRASDHGVRFWVRWSDHPDMIEEDWILSGRRLASSGVHNDSYMITARKMAKDLPMRSEEAAELFGFTPAEARVAVLLASGLGLKEIADLNGVNISTLRVQLRSIFRKTRISKQAELVALIWRVASV